MRSGTKQAQQAHGETRNEWGGLDYRGEAGLARTTVDDGYVQVFFFAGDGELLSWQASFSSATPAAITNAAVQMARRLADGRA